MVYYAFEVPLFNYLSYRGYLHRISIPISGCKCPILDPSIYKKFRFTQHLHSSLAALVLAGQNYIWNLPSQGVSLLHYSFRDTLLAHLELVTPFTRRLFANYIMKTLFTKELVLYDAHVAQLLPDLYLRNTSYFNLPQPMFQYYTIALFSLILTLLLICVFIILFGWAFIK